MDANELYGSKYLGAADLNGQDIAVQILEVEKATFKNAKGEDTYKFVLVVSGYSKKITVNMTNARTLMHLFTPNTDNWKGKRITLHPDITQYGGKAVDCLRFKPASQKAPEGNGPLAGYTDRVMQQQHVAKLADVGYDDRPEPDDDFDPLG